MEKIITVKQEPIDDAYPTVPLTTTSPSVTTENVTIINSVTPAPPSAAVPVIPTTTTQPETQVILLQPKGETQKAPCPAIAISQGATITATTGKTITTTAQPTTPLVVISGSPIKLTPISRAGTALSGGQSNSNITVFQVQPLNATTKQPLAPKTGGSPSKQPVQLQFQKLLPISIATTLSKIQQGATPQFTIAAPTGQTTNVRHIAPKVSIVSAVPSGATGQLATSQVRNIAPAEKPVQVPQQLAPKPPTQSQATIAGQQQPRLIVPALPSNITQIPGRGQATNLQFPHGVISGGVVYLPQHALASGGFPIAVPLQANTLNSGAQGGVSVNGGSPESSPPTRPRKPCNCTKSQCLKLYCDCFANGEFCSNCNCVNCSNNMEHEKERSKAIKACLERNPQAFHPKIGKGRGDSDRRHNKGCHCKRSGCLKNYCECYEAKILCTNLCKCTGCKNFEESPERKTLMHLADAAEVRVKQQNAARTKLESQIEDLPSRPSFLAMSGERLPFSFVTDEVVEATCRCLLARAVEAENEGKSPIMTEKMILEEFGRSLLRIIHTANGTRE